MQLISIVTINFNNAAGLQKTLDSVAAQTCIEFEHIIVDGASTDGSVDEIVAYSQSPIANRHKITWLSEPDTGIYNAMNKGVNMATGEYLLFLNSGDYLVNESVIEKVVPFLNSIDIIQGNTIEDVGGKVYRNRGYGKSNIDLFDVMKGHFLHQASFCRKELFDKYGMYDESYRIAGDTKFFMNCLGCRNATFKYVDLDIANYDVTGISAQHTALQKNEADRIYTELFSERTNQFFFDNEKKISLYNKLRAHKWVWNSVMLIIRVSDFIYRNSKSNK